MRLKERTRAMIIILIMALIIVSPIALNKIGLVGVDSYFHFNRIYDAAMQIKNHNFSYLNLYSFQQSGRIVNEVYSPLITYLCGALLLISGNWFRFQLIFIVIICFISGITAYYAAKRLKLSYKTSLAISGIYMSSFSVYGIIYSTNWRGIAASFIPLLVVSMVDLYKGDWSFKEMTLMGVAMALIIQSQLLAGAMLAPALVPFFVVGLVKSRKRLRSFGYSVWAVVLAVILSLNILLPYYELVSENKLLPPTRLQLIDGVKNLFNPVFNGKTPLSTTIMCFLLYLSLALLILFWKRISGFSKWLSIVSIVYMIIGTNLVPWAVIGDKFPMAGNLLQLPYRFTIVALIFVVFGAALIVRDLIDNQTVKLSTISLDFGSMIFAMMSVLTLTMAVASWVELHNDPSVTIAKGIGTDDGNVIIPKYEGEKVEKITQVQPSFHTKNLKTLIFQVDRVTPDYVPIKEDYVAYEDYYELYREKVIRVKSGFNHKVLPHGVLQLSWDSKKAKMGNVPVIAYKNTQVKFNGKKISHDQLKQSEIGTLQLKSRKGHNSVQVSYQPKLITRLGVWIAGLSWIAIIIDFAFFRRINKNKGTKLKTSGRHSMS